MQTSQTAAVQLKILKFQLLFMKFYTSKRLSDISVSDNPFFLFRSYSQNRICIQQYLFQRVVIIITLSEIIEFILFPSR